MDPLSLYYIRQAGRGSERVRVNDVIGPVYATASFVQRGHGIGSFLTGLFRFIRPIFVSGAKPVGRESLRTGGKILPISPARRAGSSRYSGETRDQIGTGFNPQGAEWTRDQAKMRSGASKHEETRLRRRRRVREDRRKQPRARNDRLPLDVRGGLIKGTFSRDARQSPLSHVATECGGRRRVPQVGL